MFGVRERERERVWFAGNPCKWKHWSKKIKEIDLEIGSSPLFSN